MLYKIVQLKPGAWDGPWRNVVAVTKALASNWRSELPEILTQLRGQGIGIEEFFRLERAVTFKLAALISDVNILHQIIIDRQADVSSFVAKLGHAFLLRSVYHLEEYGLPRMITKKIHRAGLIDFSSAELDLKAALDEFQRLGLDEVERVQTLSAFDQYVVRFFFDGITPATPQDSLNVRYESE